MSVGWCMRTYTHLSADISCHESQFFALRIEKGSEAIRYMLAELHTYGKINFPVGRLTPDAGANQVATACPRSTDLSRDPRQRQVFAAGQDCTELAVNVLAV